MDGTVSFVEFGSDDPAVAGSFLAELFGWRFHPMMQGGYFETPAGRAGLHGNDPEQTYLYYGVADLDKAMKRVEALGGVAKPQGEGDTEFGRFADCTGPGGVRFGLHQKPG